MKEQLYTIPVTDIFKEECECPICSIRKHLDDDAVAFAMGPSYMEDDIRLTTDKIGFCPHHLNMMYQFENRLGLGLILNTHMQDVIKNLEALQKKGRKSAGGFFSKIEESKIFEYTKRTSQSCFLCDRIKDMYTRYLYTIFYLYEKDDAFRTRFRKGKGFCLEHYGMLYEMAPDHLSGPMLEDFTSDLNKVAIAGFKRVQEDVSWFVDKFDYRNTDASWKTSRDALQRGMTKCNCPTQEFEDIKNK